MAVIAIPAPEVERGSIAEAAEVLESLDAFRSERSGLPACRATNAASK